MRRFGALEVRALFQDLRKKTLSVLHVRLKPYAAAPALYHRRTEEFFLILRGTVHGRVGNRRRTFKAGDYCYLPPGTLHEFRAGKDGADTLDVFFPGLDLEKPDITLA